MKAPLLTLVLALPLAAGETPETMKAAADAFLTSLGEDGRKEACFPFDSETREHFRFTPQTRDGVSIKQMTAAQRKAADTLLASALSEQGLHKTRQIRRVEGLLGKMEKRPDHRDPEKYHVSIFGTPGAEAGWAWKFEGHHIGLNYTIAPGGKVAVTPSFFGANPAVVPSGDHQGLEVLKAEHELARELLTLLLKAGKSEVVFSPKAPADVISGEERAVKRPQPVGVAAKHMSAEQSAALTALITEYAKRHNQQLANAELDKIRKAGIDKIHFGWAGSTEPGGAWYYRVQGPDFMMEAANTQNDANHIHTAWRSFDGDFGRDLFSEHYHQHDKDHGNH